MPLLLQRAHAAISAAHGERAVHNFLKSAPVLLVEAFNTGNNTQLVAAEFKFGNRYRADFCVLSGTSASWDVHLIELEPVKAQIFTKDGSDSRTLNKAKAQLQDWSHYIATHPFEFREEIARDVLRRNLFCRRDNGPLTSWHEKELLSPQMGLYCQFHIVIGRRASLQGEDLRRRSFYYGMHNCRIATYDRFLELAEQHDHRLKVAQKAARARKLTAEQVAPPNAGSRSD
jgi:hypothetical protein